MKLSPFPNSFKRIKQLFDLIFSKICSEDGDFPHCRDHLVLFWFLIDLQRNGTIRFINTIFPGNCTVLYSPSNTFSINKIPLIDKPLNQSTRQTSKTSTRDIINLNTLEKQPKQVVSLSDSINLMRRELMISFFLFTFFSKSFLSFNFQCWILG